MKEFRYTSYAQEIIFGAGSVTQLEEVVERFHMQRLMLCTSGSLRREGQVALIEQVLGDRLVAVYEKAKTHVPDFQVDEAFELAHKHDIDALLGLGGGSPIGLVKAVSMALEENQNDGQSQEATPIEQPLIPVIAIPTTYAGSEMTPTFGVTYHTNGITRKVTRTDAKITPKVVIYDPLLTLNLPAELTAATGINALAHCIEALYSLTTNPLSTSIALSGVRLIYNALPRCYEDGKDLAARTQMLEGAYFAGFALAHVSMALHHGLCHTLGGTAGVSHGYANSIILPHALRFNLDVVTPQLALMAEAMGIDRNIGFKLKSDEEMAMEAVDKIYLFIHAMNLPQHLSEVGVEKSEIPYLAQMAMQSRAIRSNPKKITHVTQIEEILYAAL